MTVSIYRMDDCDHYAAESEEQAKAFYEEQSFDGKPPDDDGFWVLDNADMEWMCITIDEDGLWGLAAGSYRFSSALAAALASGETTPFVFSSTEQ